MRMGMPQTKLPFGTNSSQQQSHNMIKSTGSSQPEGEKLILGYRSNSRGASHAKDRY
jgi:hypothetical protein